MNIFNILKNVDLLFEESIENFKGKSKLTLLELHSKVLQTIKDTSNNILVRQSQKNFYISGPNISSPEEAKNAANTSISSYCEKQKQDTNYISKISEIKTKKNQKNFKWKP